MSSFDTAWKIVKRDGLDYGQQEIPESLASTYLTGIPSLKTIGEDQRTSSRASAGKSPVNIKRVSGAHSSSSTRGNSTDHKKTQAESSVDAKFRNAGAKGQR